MTLAIAIGFSASAQYDLEAIELRTMSTTNGEVPPNVPLILTLVFENTGTQDIPDQSTARLLFINGLDTFQDIIGTFNGAMPVGAQISFNSDPVTLPAAPPIANLCGFILMDSTWAETDSTNNLVCETLQVSSSAVVDLKAQRVIVNAPNDLDGFDLVKLSVNSVCSIRCHPRLAIMFLYSSIDLGYISLSHLIRLIIA